MEGKGLLFKIFADIDVLTLKSEQRIRSSNGKKNIALL
jgi:malic enzyme